MPCIIFVRREKDYYERSGVSVSPNEAVVHNYANAITYMYARIFNRIDLDDTSGKLNLYGCLYILSIFNKLLYRGGAILLAI